MSGLGQKQKGSNRAFHVRFSPDSGGRADTPDRPLGATTGREQAQQTAQLFDHLVGAHQE